MLWIISVAVVCAVVACVMVGLWLFERNLRIEFVKAIDRKNEEEKVLISRCNCAEKLSSNRLYERNAAVEQAKAFQSVAKTMEEHLAAERSRADHLEKALLKMKEEGRQASKPDGLSKEWANIFAYNGTGDGQEDV